MQQSMYIISLPIVLGSFWIGDWLHKGALVLFGALTRTKKLDTSTVYTNSFFPLILVLLFFLYSTGTIPEVFGENSALLHFSNTGRYYDSYLIKDSEVAGVAWLDVVAKKIDIAGVKIKIQTDRFSQARLASLRTLDATNEIFPGAVRKESYVFLGQATVRKQRATLVFGGDQITYKYPVGFLNENKNLIYNNGGAMVYR
jgi:hypothetical protein